ncbi:MAG: formate dehydrogenase subunit alpha [Candidatus Thermoplasmatota archaeon]|nr:formate dehydrogenase subunit alpha [Candidatus Thermoplasmatota archaeon]
MSVLTVCPYCGTGCQIVINDLGIEERVVGYSRSSVNEGKLCIKGMSGLSYNSSNERLRYPLVKRNGDFVRVSWKEALEETASRFVDLINRYGPDSVAFQSSAKCTNEENYLMQKIARMVGTNNIDHCARSCHSPTALGLISTLGAGAATGSIRSLDDSRTYFVIGSNTTEQHPIIGTRIVKGRKNGKNLIVADPRKTQLAEIANIHLQFKPGTDIALLNSMMYVILEDGIEDRKFIDERTTGFLELQNEVRKYAPEKTEGITGIKPDLLREAARIIARERPTSILYAMGITQHVHGTENVMSVSNLALVTGNVGRRGSGIFPLRGQNNVQGSSDMGALSEWYPGYVPVDSPKVEPFERLWGRSLPRKRGLSLSEMFDAAADGEIKAIYVMGENPLVTETSVSDVERGVENLELFVVQDIFMTLTAGHADIVLPASTSLEKEGTFTNTERRIQKVNKVYDSPGESRPDWWILKEIGRRIADTPDYESPEEIFNEIRRAVPSYSGATYDSIYPLGKQWPINIDNPDGTEILHTATFPIGKGRLVPVAYGSPAEATDDKYDMVMTTGRNYFHYHSGTMSRRADLLDRESPGPYAEINPQDAKRLGIRDSQFITIESRHGSIRTRSRVTDRVPKGIVFVPFHYDEARVNRLVGKALDPMSKIPEFKVVAVRLLP